MGNANLLGLINQSWYKTLIFVGLYFVIGTIWSVIRWAILCNYLFREYYESKQEWLESRDIIGTMQIPEDLKEAWLDYIRHHPFERNKQRYILGVAPIASCHKSEIMIWMIYWPLSLIDFAIGDLLVEIFKKIYMAISGLLQKISNRIFQNHLVMVEE
jgi:hypothetical protein